MKIMKHLKLLISIVTIAITSLNSVYIAQENNEHVIPISSEISEVIINLHEEIINDDSRIEKIINSYNNVVGVLKVERMEGDKIKIQFTTSKLNGPGIFLGLALEMEFSKAKFETNK